MTENTTTEKPVSGKKEFTLTDRKTGKVYKPARLTYGDIIEAAKRCPVEMANPLETVALVYDKLPPAMAKQLTDRAYQDAISGNKTSIYQMARGLDTMEGLLETLLIAVQKNHPDATRDLMIDLLSGLTKEEMESLSRDRDQYLLPSDTITPTLINDSEKQLQS